MEQGTERLLGSEATAKKKILTSASQWKEAEFFLTTAEILEDNLSQADLLGENAA